MKPKEIKRQEKPRDLSQPKQQLPPQKQQIEEQEESPDQAPPQD